MITPGSWRLKPDGFLAGNVVATTALLAMPPNSHDSVPPASALAAQQVRWHPIKSSVPGPVLECREREPKIQSRTLWLSLSLSLSLLRARSLSPALFLSLSYSGSRARSLSFFLSLAHFRSRHLSLSLSFSLILSFTQSSRTHWKVMAGHVISMYQCVHLCVTHMVDRQEKYSAGFTCPPSKQRR